MAPTANAKIHLQLEPVARAVPIIGSLAMIGLVLITLMALNGHRETDEGWQAHLFQLTMLGQLPFIAFLTLSDQDRRRRNRLVIAAQIMLWLAAIALVRMANL